MAGFKCDICGGDIKMQANKTGVCQTCGMQYDLEAIRAMLGQKPTTPVQSAPPLAAAPAKEELDREALLVYLNDVRILETIISEDKQKIKKLKEKKTEIVYKTEAAKQAIPKEVKKTDALETSELDNAKNELSISKEKAEKVKKLDTKVSICAFGVPIIFSIIAFLLPNDDGEAILPILLLALAVLSFFIFFPIFCIIIRKAKKRLESDLKEKQEIYNKCERKYNANRQKIDQYKSYMRAYPIALEKYNSIQQECSQFLDAYNNEYEPQLNSELSESIETLNRAYNANIIPQQFRSIEGVYYLYDYLSTSNQSLSEALMQANLEAIKQKMDSMIKLQSAQIIQQAQTNAKLENIQQQNERLAQLSEATMNNTAVAAKYAQIAAINSELNVKLAAESLAYQKAAFWLE